MKKKVLYWSLISIFAAVFIYSAVVVVDYMVDSYKHKQMMEEIRKLHTYDPDAYVDPTQPTPPTDPEGSSSTEATNPTDPSQPSNGNDDPVMPTRPSVPVDPTQPSDPPVDPTQPTDPVDPPVDPDPTKPPVDPTQPTDPVDPPVKPTQPTQPKPTDPKQPPFETKPSVVKPEILPEMQAVYAANNDTVGWITINGTNIDYPVLQRKDTQAYYLYRNFYGEDDNHGSIYVEEHNDVDKPSDVIVLHGHHMADGTMFHNIKNFKYKTFFNEHPYVRFDTLYQHRIYQVVLIFRINAEPSDTEHFFPFHTYNNFKDEAHFNDFMSNIQRLAVQKSRVKVNYGDKLLLMVTCDYSPYINGRLILVAKMIQSD